MLFFKKVKLSSITINILFDVTYFPNSIDLKKVYTDNDYVVTLRPNNEINEYNRQLKRSMGNVKINRAFNLFYGSGLVARIYEFANAEQASDYDRHNDLSEIAKVTRKDQYLYMDLGDSFTAENNYRPALRAVKEEALALFKMYFDEQNEHNAYIQSLKIV